MAMLNNQTSNEYHGIMAQCPSWHGRENIICTDTDESTVLSKRKAMTEWPKRNKHEPEGFVLLEGTPKLTWYSLFSAKNANFSRAKTPSSQPFNP